MTLIDLLAQYQLDKITELIADQPPGWEIDLQNRVPLVRNSPLLTNAVILGLKRKKSKVIDLMPPALVLGNRINFEFRRF